MGKENGLEIQAVETDELRGGIPLAGWTSVKNILTILSYASAMRHRRTGGGHDNESPITPEEFQYTARTSSTHVNQNGGYEVTIPDEMEITPLIEELTAEARGMVEKNAGQIWTTAGRNSHASSKVVSHSLYGEMLTIRRIQPEALLLEMGSLHEDWDDEEELANSLGIERGLNWKGVRLRLEPTGDRFVVDFDQITERVNPLLSDNRVRGVDFAQRLYVNSTRPGGHWDRSAPLAYIDGLELRIQLEGSDPGSWEVDGAVLSGPFKHYTSIVDGLLKPTTLVFAIQRRSSEFQEATSVADPATKTAMIGLADRVAEVFRNR